MTKKWRPTMPMPVKPKEMTIEFLENGKWKAWEKDRKNCYAAGKADALPPWPPENRTKFELKGDLYLFESLAGDFLWYYKTEYNGYQVAFKSLQTFLTAAYF